MKQGRQPAAGAGRRWWMRGGLLAVTVVLGLAALQRGAVAPSPGPQGSRQAAPAAVRFDVAAPVAYLMDGETGQVLFEKGGDRSVHPASIVKVMTMLVALDAVERGFVSLGDQVRISRRAESMGGSQAYLAAGEVFTLEQLLRAVAIASANDAAVAVAEHVAGTEATFAELMNRRAQQLGLRDTQFTNAHGLPPEEGQDPNLTTARDVAIMARELIRSHPVVLEWTSTPRELFRQQPRFVLENTNRLVGRYPGADGLKTGFTDQAGYSVVATAERDGRRLIAVVMGAQSDEARVEQTATLFDFGFRAYRPVVAALEGERVGWLRLRSARPEQVGVRAAGTLRVLTLGGESRGVTRRLEFRQGLAPPIREGEAVGSVVALVEGQPVVRVPVVTEAAMGRAPAFMRLWRWLRDVVGALVPGSSFGPLPGPAFASGSRSRP